jgi:hypothetical protein
MNATLHFQRGPLLALLALFFLAVMAALAPGLSEVDLSGLAGDGPAGFPAEVSVAPAPASEGAPIWLSDPLEPPLAGMERAVAAR